MTGPQVVWAHSAAAEYDDLPLAVRERIDAALAILVLTGRGDVRRLAATRTAEYRLRVGDYRVRFAAEADQREIVVPHVFHRGRG